MADLVALLAALTVAGAPVVQAPAKGLPVAELPAIIAGMEACVASASASGIEEAVLIGRGFEQATSADLNGLRFFIRDGVMLVMARQGTKPAQMCVASARIQDVPTFPKLIQALSATLKSAPKQTSPSDFFWVSNGRGVQMSTTGNPTAPATRISVMYLSPEKK